MLYLKAISLATAANLESVLETSIKFKPARYGMLSAGLACQQDFEESLGLQMAVVKTFLR